MPPPAPQRRLAAILAADMVGYSRMIERDEAGTVARLKADREELIDPTVSAHAGRIVRMAGDGALLEFPSVVEAAQCAIEIQRGMLDRNAARVEDERIVFRIGVNTGDIIVEDDNLHGEGINIAARLEGLCDPGGILLSEEAARYVEGKVQARLEFLEERTVKNIERPVRIWRVVTDDGERAPRRHRSSDNSHGTARRLMPVGLAVAVVVAIAVTLWIQLRAPPAKPLVSAERSVSRPDGPSLVVLPFENLSADPEQDYFADGISDDLITDLSQISELFVIARHTAFVYKGRSLSVERIGEELGVRYVLEGSVRRAGGRVRINAQLTDAASGGSLWAERYDREMADIFDLQDEVAGRIVSALSLELTSAERGRLALRSTDNPEAYDLFLKGQEHYFRQTEKDNRRARELYQRAIEEDPDFARAYGALAVAQGRDFYFGWNLESRESLQGALRLAMRSVTLGAALPQTHWALAYIRLFLREYDQAIAAAQQAIALDPSYTDGYGLLAWIYTSAGEPIRAIELVMHALEYDPHPGGQVMQVLGQAQYWADLFDEAVVTNEQAVDINPNLIDARLYLAATYVRLGRLDDAKWEAQEILSLKPDFTLAQWALGDPVKEPRSSERLLDDLLSAGLI